MTFDELQIWLATPLNLAREIENRELIEIYPTVWRDYRSHRLVPFRIWVDTERERYDADIDVDLVAGVRALVGDVRVEINTDPEAFGAQRMDFWVGATKKPKGKSPVRSFVSSAKIGQVFPLRYDGGGTRTPTTCRNDLGLSLSPEKIPFADHCVGVEIEVEKPGGDEFRVSKTAGLVGESFNITADGSLRDGVEYVSRFGMTAGDVVSYMEPMDKFLNKSRFSLRCGLHCHIDVSEHTLEDVYKVCLLYSVFEQLLFEVSGSRNANKFCVAVQDSATVIGSLINYGHRNDWPNVADALYKGSKYMAMNIKPVCSRGSIEFRHHYGTARKEAVQHWLAYLLDIVVGAKGVSLGDLETHILNLNTKSDYAQFIATYLPNSHKNLPRETKHWIPMLYDGVAFVKECWAAEPEDHFKRGQE